MSSRVRPAPVEVKYKHMRFLIIHNPDSNGLPEFIGELKKRDVQEVVRVCEPKYDKELLAKEGIEVLRSIMTSANLPREVESGQVCTVCGSTIQRTLPCSLESYVLMVDGCLADAAMAAVS
ncbi:hypothetical protein BSL78_23752 [Apostichopus japonicus]|uniref:Uncharacterized protein n=1 Tax=Stichopus japonicus TaxID=307972 RepID=A0A2G8JUM2_STIJA|nr:hypothetical protein BSL78_23752 [Apostichopus japonicus]